MKELTKLPVFEAQRTDNKKWVRGRIGIPLGERDDGVEETTFFYFYDGNHWGECAVITNTIKQIS